MISFDFGVKTNCVFLLRRGFRVCGRDEGAMETDECLRSPPRPLRCAHSRYLVFIVTENDETSPKQKARAFPIPEKHGALSICNGLQALETLAAVVEQGGVGAGVFHGNAAAENDAGLRVIGDAAGDVQGGVNRFGQARQSRCAAA